LNNFVVLNRLCPTRGPHATQSRVLCGPTCPCFDNLEFDILMQVVLSAPLSRLLPLQLGSHTFSILV